MILKATNVHDGYGKKEVLHGINLDIRQGEILAFIGPNGAGKSTFLKVLAGLLQPKAGKILYRDRDITYWDCPRRVDAGIVYFMQGGEVFPNLSVRENLELGCGNGKLNGKLEEVFQFFPDIRDWLSMRAGLLSGGQRQQVALAMVLLKQPKFLLLDEPSAGLSPKLVADILTKIKQINSKFCSTIVLVEQNVKEGLKIAHRCAIMANGQIVAIEENPHKLQNENKLIEKVFLGID